MDTIRTLHLKILQGRLTTLAAELGRVEFAVRTLPRTWSPRLNLYRCADRLVICAELAGIDRAEIELQVTARRVWLGGWRRPPLPDESAAPLQQVLALEIDEGRCEREILLPVEVVPEQTCAEQRNGLLWIDLPLRSPPLSA